MSRPIIHLCWLIECILYRMTSNIISYNVKIGQKEMTARVPQLLLGRITVQLEVLSTSEVLDIGLRVTVI